jgi:DNA-binding NarL/FixJ family response regulator
MIGDGRGDQGAIAGSGRARAIGVARWLRNSRTPALLAPAITRRLIERFASAPKATDDDRLDTLTDRERDVLRLIARGLSNTEIATELFVSHGTVKTHVGRILTKLDLRDRVQAVVLAYETGLVQPGHTPS